MKKKLVGVTLLFASISLLAACGGKTKNNSDVEQDKPGQKLSSKDIVSKKDTVVDGKEMTEYEMKNGTKVQLPRDIDLDKDEIIMDEPIDPKDLDSETLESLNREAEGKWKKDLLF